MSVRVNGGTYYKVWERGQAFSQPDNYESLADALAVIEHCHKVEREGGYKPTNYIVTRVDWTAVWEEKPERFVERTETERAVYRPTEKDGCDE